MIIASQLVVTPAGHWITEDARYSGHSADTDVESGIIVGLDLTGSSALITHLEASGLIPRPFSLVSICPAYSVITTRGA